MYPQSYVSLVSSPGEAEMYSSSSLFLSPLLSSTSTVAFTQTTSSSVDESSTASSSLSAATTSNASSSPNNLLSVTNTTPCNGYPQLCNRKYSNVSTVVAHNSPFNMPLNPASNQLNDVTQQLNDGIRGLQFETHMNNNLLHLCHTSCDLLDAGTLEAYLETVVQWLKKNPNEVLTIIMGNDDRVDPTTYIAPFKNSGLLPYLYTPPQQSMSLSAWPTLSDMTKSGNRVVVMLDYLANPSTVPWLLDEFSHQWETPFSPTDLSFPCTQQRPPNQSRAVSQDRMYMTNHNLNVELGIASLGLSVLVPSLGSLDQVNSADSATMGSLQRGVDTCMGAWNRPPNFLLVDFYNMGNVDGSVFDVAAGANGVS